MSRHPAEALTVLPRGEGGSTRFGVAKIETNIVTLCCINLCSNQNIAVWGAFPGQRQKWFCDFYITCSLKRQFLCILVCKCSFKHLLKSLGSHPNWFDKSACAAHWHFCGRSVQYFGPSGVRVPVQGSGH